MKGGGNTEIILYIIVFIVVLIAVALTAYFFANLYEQRKSQQTILLNRNPPRQYAQYVGLVCPDGWENSGPDTTDATSHLCKNIANVPVNITNQQHCYNKDIPTKISSFKNLDWTKLDIHNSNFSTTDPKPPGVADIMSFVNQCGPTTNTPAVWSGVNTQNGWITF